MNGHVEAGGSRADRVERALHVPVLVAAGTSVPAVFLSPFEGVAGLIGAFLNWLSMVVLTGESALLFVLSGNRVRWLRQHWWLVLVTVCTVPAVLFAVGPAQVLRLVRVATAVHVLKVGRLVKVARIVQRRGERFGRLRAVLAYGVAVLAGVFLLAVLVDPDSSVRRAFAIALELWGWGPLLGACVLLLFSGVAMGALRARWVAAHRGRVELDEG